MILKELSLLLICFSVMHSNVAGEDLSLKGILSSLQHQYNLNFIDNVMDLCLVQQIFMMKNIVNNSDAVKGKFDELKIKTINILHVMSNNLFKQNGHNLVQFYKELKEKKAEAEKSKLNSVFKMLSNNVRTHEDDLARIIQERKFSDADLNAFEKTCNTVLEKFNNKEEVKWLVAEIDKFGDDITFDSINILLVKFRMMTKVIDHSTIERDENILYDDNKPIPYTVAQNVEHMEKVVLFFRRHMCYSFSQYLLDIALVYKHFVEVIKTNPIPTAADTDSANYIKAMYKEFREIINLISTFKNVGHGCIDSSEISQLTGEFIKIHNEFKSYFIKLLKVFDSSVTEGSLKTNEDVKNNNVLKYLLVDLPSTESIKSKYEDKFNDDRDVEMKTGIEDYFIDDDSFKIPGQDVGVQKYPKLLTNEIEKVMCFRSVISYVTTNLFWMEYRTIPINSNFQETNLLYDAVPSGV